MKSTGIIRRIDDLGRVVIPKDIRRTMGIKESDPLEICTIDGCVAFRKYKQPTENKAAIAQKWLEDNAAFMRTASAKFTIEDRTTTCEVIVNNHRRDATTTAMVGDTFIPSVGMVIAYCRAMGRDAPQELLED